jgi:hypothetical protein
MSHFYGKLQGSASEVTRCGTKQSGLTSFTAGWKGCIETHVWTNQAGEDYFRVSLTPWQSSGGKTIPLFSGKLDATFTEQPSIQTATRLINTVTEQVESLTKG